MDDHGPDARLALEGPQPPSRRRRIIVIVALAAATILLGWLLYGGKEDTSDPLTSTIVAQQIPTVSVAVPGRRTVTRTLTANGSLAARREMPVGVAGEGGMITRVTVEPGDWAKAGAVLATVDRSVQVQTAASIAAQVRAAEADLTLAQAELERAQQLVGRGFISKADLDRRRATRDAANARVGVARAQLGETRARNSRLDIRAPAAGLVLTRAAEPGQIVSAGSGVLFRMAKDGELEMLAALSEADLATSRVGAQAQVTPVGSSRSFTGRIWQVSPVVDPQTRQGTARIALSYDPALRPGGFASATITAGSSVVPLLPNSALQSDARGSYVYVVLADDKVARRNVTVGDVSDEGVAITGGLNGTERVVLTAGAFLSAGQKIKPRLVRLQAP